MSRSALLLATCLGLGVAAAQDAELPAFDVASIKPQEGRGAAFGPSSPDRFAHPEATLKSLVEYAYDIRDFQVEGGPDWADSRRFDVSARAPGAVGTPVMRRMMQRLLAERFQLRTHVETREMAGYALVKARADGRLGERLREATVDCAAILSQRAGALPATGGDAPECAWRVGIAPPVATMFVDGAPLRDFAGLLERLVRRPVVDRTGLDGTFDIRLEFSADLIPLNVPPPTGAEPARDGLSLFTALEEQLGLRLQAERVPVTVIVIDEAQLPSPD